VAAFQKAAQPVFDKLQENSFNAEAIAAIRELKAKTQSSPSAQACASSSAASMQASTEDQAWSQGLFPNGVWQVKLSEDDIVKMGVLKSNAPEWAGTWTWTFQDGKAHLKAEVDITIECDSTYTVVKDFVRINYSDSKDCSAQEVDDIQWRLDADGLHFHLVAITHAPFTENKAYLEAKPWQKIEAWSQGLLPNGVWQAELSVEDLVAVGGVMESSVRENAGVHTFTFQDGNFTWTLQGDSSGSCEGTYSLVGDINRLTLTGGCAPEVDDIQWRLDDEGLHLHLVAIENAPFEVIRASLEARPYQKVADK